MAGRSSTCTLCHEPVIWAKTANKRPMPLDAEPVPTGNCWFENGVVVVASKNNPRPAHGRFFTSHFQHCEPYIAQKRVEAAIVRAEKESERRRKEAAAREVADAVAGLVCPTCRDTGVVERPATPDEVDEGCELGVAYDPCPDPWHHEHDEVDA